MYITLNIQNVVFSLFPQNDSVLCQRSLGPVCECYRCWWIQLSNTLYVFGQTTVGIWQSLPQSCFTCTQKQKVRKWPQVNCIYFPFFYLIHISFLWSSLTGWVFGCLCLRCHMGLCPAPCCGGSFMLCSVQRQQDWKHSALLMTHAPAFRLLEVPVYVPQLHKILYFLHLFLRATYSKLKISETGFF